MKYNQNYRDIPNLMGFQCILLD